jgi:hypothetical protein
MTHDYGEGSHSRICCSSGNPGTKVGNRRQLPTRKGSDTESIKDSLQKRISNVDQQQAGKFSPEADCKKNNVASRTGTAPPRVIAERNQQRLL